MLKVLALSASVLAFASGLALADPELKKGNEKESLTTMTGEPSTVTNPSSSLSTAHWLASDVYKVDVYDPSEHKSRQGQRSYDR
ncbi:MAG: hypothetical protein M3178_09665 [Pseudomonadota bacterium]|nr:hypothetical protein [Pseudomonadota bacterium]